MTKRILMTVLLLGGLFGVSSFANTFIVGVENDPAINNTVELVGDYNDMMVQLSAVGLTATTGGTWSNFLTAPINESGASTTNPFWDNVSLDDPAAPAGAPKNVGYCLTTTNCNTQAPGLVGVAEPTQYLTTTGNLGMPSDFYFTFSGPIGAVDLGEIAAGEDPYESFGIYNTSNGGQIQWLIINGVVNPLVVVGGSFTPAYSSFGLVFELSNVGDVYYSQNSVGAFVGGAYTTTGVPDNRFALFQTPDATGVPEPGTMALFGIGALALGLIPRLRKRS
jgi:hypothetical protein